MADNDFYFSGYSLSIQNSKSLSKIADKSAEENEYGIACSLNVLAAEEAAKAIAIISEGANPNKDSAAFNKIFRDHKSKHEHLFILTSINQMFIEKLNKTYDIEGSVDFMESLLEPQRSLVMDKYERFYENSKWLLKQNENKIDINESKKWWDKANIEKNKGFYVDLNNNSWHNPRASTKEKYLIERTYTLSIIEAADKILNIMDLPKIMAELQNFR